MQYRILTPSIPTLPCSPTPPGCGLPPGPSGLLGAAEGLSYLFVGGMVLWSLSQKLSTGRGEP